MLFLYVQLLMYREMFYICSDYAPLRTFAKLDLFLRSKHVSTRAQMSTYIYSLRNAAVQTC